MKLEERETTIRWDRLAPDVSIWSADPKVWRKLARMGVHPAKETTTDGEPSGKFYRVPVAVFRWGLKRKGVPGAPRPRGFQPRTREPSV